LGVLMPNQPSRRPAPGQDGRRNSHRTGSTPQRPQPQPPPQGTRLVRSSVRGIAVRMSRSDECRRPAWIPMTPARMHHGPALRAEVAGGRRRGRHAPGECYPTTARPLAPRGRRDQTELAKKRSEHNDNLHVGERGARAASDTTTERHPGVIVWTRRQEPVRIECRSIVEVGVISVAEADVHDDGVTARNHPGP
jgi:hypothetical protein